MRWMNRVLSGMVALVWIGWAFTDDRHRWQTVGSMAILVALALSCIWFPKESGAHTSWRITKPSPACLVWFFGWVLLLLPLCAAIILAWR